MYTNQDNIHIVVELLKKHGITNIIISPGGTNIPFIRAVQDDPFFNCYSVVDERSAAYFAIGISLQVKKTVALLCTSAQATRNYIPGLTEAFYKRIPILAITMEKHPRFKYQEYMQAPDQTSLPNDAVKKSFELPYISDYNDYIHSIRLTNEAILESISNGNGPVQLCVPWLDFEKEDIKLEIKKIDVIENRNLKKIDVGSKKVVLAIGEHVPFSDGEKSAINNFCERTNSVVYVNHLSNYKNKYSIEGNLLLSTITSKEFDDLSPDILITIGGQTGDYPFYLSFSSNVNFEHWRISEDRRIIDTYDKLTKSFYCSIEEGLDFIVGDNCKHFYYQKWINLAQSKTTEINLPFSNVSVAQFLTKRLPSGSIIQFSILNTLRVWSLFHFENEVECYSNVGAFGIDGGMSTLIGQSVVTEKLSIMIVGDLAFFYDMNSLGIRHKKNNLRILLINNNGGVEFKLHGGNQRDIDRYIAAGNHYADARGWAETCGFSYFSAHSQKEFEENAHVIYNESEKPILFEVFVADVDESDAYNSLIEANKTKTPKEQLKYCLKSTIKGVLGTENYRRIRGTQK